MNCCCFLQVVGGVGLDEGCFEYFTVNRVELKFYDRLPFALNINHRINNNNSIRYYHPLLLLVKHADKAI